MPIADSTLIQTLTGWSATIGDKVANHLTEAEYKAKEVLSTNRTRGEASGTEGSDNYKTILDAESERYDEIAALGAGNKHYVALQRAEAKLAIYYALPFLNLRPTEKGGLTKALGNVEGGIDVMGTRELTDVRRELFAQSLETLKRLIRKSEADEKVVYTL